MSRWDWERKAWERDKEAIGMPLAIVCSDRGQHARIRLTSMYVWPTGFWKPDGGPHVYRHYDPPLAGEAGRLLPHDLQCRKCGRNPQVSAERWDMLMLGARRAEADSVDMSYYD